MRMPVGHIRGKHGVRVKQKASNADHLMVVLVLAMLLVL